MFNHDIPISQTVTRSSLRTRLRRVLFKLLVGSAAIGLSMLAGKTSNAAAPQSELEEQREALRDRVARVRAVLEVHADKAIEKKNHTAVAQWYNWGNWRNGWDNNWNNWPNRWWKY